jgi:hypothetical protein
MKILSLSLVLFLASSVCAQIATPDTVPTWQSKLNLYQTDTITNIKTTLQSKKYETVKIGYKSTVIGNDLKNSVDHDLNFNIGGKFLSGTVNASVANQKSYGAIQDFTNVGLSYAKSSYLTNVKFSYYQSNQFKTKTGQSGGIANLDLTYKF